ncbi:MAG: hypothetical protein FWB98_00825 [Defluviitaleaceae bacterium]|nr:hypothetical protein [Defluviitaleaceae bacterium]
MKPFTEDRLREDIEPPPPDKNYKREKGKARLTASLEGQNPDEQRRGMAYKLTIITLVGIFGIFILAWVAMFFADGGEVSVIGEFSLSVISLLIPLLTFIFGYLFGTKQKD